MLDLGNGEHISQRWEFARGCACACVVNFGHAVFEMPIQSPSAGGRGEVQAEGRNLGIVST